MSFASYDQALTSALETKTWRGIRFDRARIGDTIRIGDDYRRYRLQGEVVAFGSQDGRITMTMHCLEHKFKHWFLPFGALVQREKTFFFDYTVNCQIWGTDADANRPDPKAKSVSKSK